MLLAWNILTLILCSMLAALALLRGAAGLVVAKRWLWWLEAVSLVLAGGAGLLGAVLVGRLLH